MNEKKKCRKSYLIHEKHLGRYILPGATKQQKRSSVSVLHFLKLKDVQGNVEALLGDIISMNINLQ